jgi:hypothetical protein
MAVCLGRHPAIHCGPETHLFSRLAMPEGQLALDPASWPDAAVDFVCQGPGGADAEQVAPRPDAARVRAFLAARAPSAAAILEALVALPAADAGKRRWAEKTPRHLELLATIREAWPDAAIVHMVRDPRPRAVSMTQVPFGADTQVANLLDGMRREKRALAAVEADPRLLTVRLEDLQATPEATLRRVTDFLREPYDPVMLVPSDRAAPVTTREWWKRAATGAVHGVDDAAWRGTMPEDVQRFASLYCADQIRRYGYPGAREPRAIVEVVPPGDRIIEGHEPMALALARRDVLIKGLPLVTWRRLRRATAIVFWGPVGELVPPNTAHAWGWRAMLVLTLDLVLRRLQRRPAGWVLPNAAADMAPDASASDDPAPPTVPRTSARWVAAIVRLLARRITPSEIEALPGLPQAASR